MKTVYFLLLALLCAPAYATIRTVNNAANGGAQFTSLQAAIDASSSGDTIYVYGSSISYGDIIVTSKKLWLIGPGYSPNKNNTLTATLGDVKFNYGLCSGSEMQGFVVTGVVSLNLQKTTTSSNDNSNFVGFTFTRNKLSQNFEFMDGSVSSNASFANIRITNNYLSNAYICSANGLNNTYTSISNIIVENNVFYKSNLFSTFNSVWDNINNVLVNHNIFFGSTSHNTFNQIAVSLTISNNIFVGSNIASSTTNGTSYSVFYNNITYNCTFTNTPWNNNNNIDGGGNIANQNPQMVDQTSVNSATNNHLLDFSINAGPAYNTGSDGKSIGLLFNSTGDLNWVNGRTSRLPRIYSLNVPSTNVTTGGNLTINVEAKVTN